MGKSVIKINFFNINYFNDRIGLSLNEKMRTAAVSPSQTFLLNKLLIKRDDKIGFGKEKRKDPQT